MGFVLEAFKVIPIPVFVAQRRRKIEGVLQTIDALEPLPVEHVVRSAAERDYACQAVGMRVREPNRVVAACGERPYADARVIDAVLGVEPVEEAAPLAVGRGRVVCFGGRVAGAWDLDYDRGDTIAAPAFHPDGEFGSVAVEAGHDEY